MPYFYGALPDRHDPRDLPFSHLRLHHPALPQAVDLRRFAPPIRDQGELGSCTGHGIVHATELVHRRAGHQLSSRSPLWIYWQERWLEHTLNEDAGAMPRDGL